ncbi:MAG: eukaryotic-like serine/threonine-protein kinase [Acidobacteriota bacterium]|nr:eukaryotic-like serine/threonine-protein kinase [Acidobacteriota bacterium]
MKICRKCSAQYEDARSFCPRDGEVLQDDHAEMIGRILDGQYEIEEFIAEGGMGAVYRARHTLLGDKVAIKILPPEMRRNPEWLKRFQREGQAARRFHHPNSVIVHDLRTSSEGENYLVMEYVVGRTLDAEVAERGGRLSLAEALQIIEPVASVLDAAHAMGVVHRDLKPSNIMITGQGNIKLLDLGVAKVSDLGAGATSLTMTGQLLGTPYYMSPEQWGELSRDGSEEIDGRTDVYSLGVVVYQITTGEFPFNGDSVVTLRRAHCNQRPRPLEAIDASIPAIWSSAVLRAMSKDRNDRQATPGELARELRAALSGVELPPDTAPSAAPTLIANQRGTSPIVRDTPHYLNAQTINASESGYAAQPTAAPHFQPAPLQHQNSKPSHTMLIVAAVAAILLLAVGGYALWQWRAGKSGEKRAEYQTKNAASETPGAPSQDAPTQDTPANTDSTPTTGEEKAVSTDGVFMRYHLLLSSTLLDEEKRASGRDAVEPGQYLQFVFTSSASGYLYVIGHDDEGNAVVIPLGDTTAAAAATAGEETGLPQLSRVKLNDKPVTESFTAIFSEKPLALPFASGTLPLDGSFRKLTADERRQIEELRKEAAPALLEFEGDKENQAAIVRLKEERRARPVMFDINLKLRRP